MSTRSNRIRIAPTAAGANGLPHSWPASLWPPSVHPCDPAKAKYFIRAHGKELLAAGAMVRVGRERVIIGAPFARWLAKQAGRVPEYEIAANRARDEQEAAP